MHLIVLALLAVARFGASPAPGLTVLSAGALEPALGQLVEDYRRETGEAVRVHFGTAPEIAARLAADDLPDLLIAPEAVMNGAAAAGRALPESRATVGRVGVGVAVRRGVAPPDLSTVGAFKETLLRSDSIVYNRASTGLYMERLLARLDIAEQLQQRTTRYGNGAQVLEHLIAGRGNEIGFGAITEIKEYEAKGLTLVGPLPAEIQNHTAYVAAITAAARDRTQAERFIRYLGTDSAKRAFIATGVQ